MAKCMIIGLICLSVIVPWTICQNNRPIIGILSQEASQGAMEGEPKNYSSYIAASYVKFMESAGARVAPIMINEDRNYYTSIANSVNGLIFPGGAQSVTNESGYGQAGQYLYEEVLRLNSEGTVMPLWATCLGFEMLSYLASGYQLILNACSASNIALPLIMEPGAETTSLLSQMPGDVRDILTTENITAHFHHWCVTRENFTTVGMDNDYQIVATDFDETDKEFISMIEHKSIPIYGTQFHPEKNSYEWKNDASHDAIPHSLNASRSAQYFAHFFVDKARQNNQGFPTPEEEEASLIYMYKPSYKGNNTNTSFMQLYFFD